MALSTLIGEGFVDIRPAFDKFAGELKTGVGNATTQASQEGSKHFDQLASVGKAAFLGIAGAAAIFGGAAIAAAVKGQESTAQLANAVRNAGGDFEGLEPKINKTTEGFAKFGYENDVAEAALTRLVQITGNTDQALSLMGLAANVAAARHIDLSAAAQLVGRVAEGNVTPLKKLTGITVEGATAAEKAANGLALLNERFGGAAQAQADTYAGKLAAFRAEVSNLTEKVGQALLPVLSTLAGDGAGVVSFFEKNQAAAVALGVAIGGPLAVAMAAYIIQQGALVAGKLLDFFLTGGKAALSFATSIGQAVTGTQNMGLAAAAGGLAIGGLVAGFAFLVQSVNNAQQSANHWAQQFATAAGGPQQQIDAINKKIKELQDGLDHSGAVAHIPFVRMAVGAQQSEDKIHALKDQLKNLQSQQEGNKKASEEQAAATGEVDTATESTTTNIDDLAASLQTTTTRAGELVHKLGIDLAKTAMPDALAKTSALSNELSFTSSHSQNLHDALGKLADQTATATEKASAFKSALDLLIGGNIDAEAAVVAFQGKIDGLSGKLRDGKLSLDVHTEAGRTNITMMEDAVVAIRNHVEALKNQGASADQLQAAFDGDTTALRNQLVQAGFTKAQIDQLIQSYGLVPSSIHTVVTADFSQAYAAAAAFAQNFKQLFDAGIPAPLRGKVLGRGAYFPGGHPELAVVGDTREVMLPLDDPRRMAELLSQAGVGRGASAAAAGSVAPAGLGGVNVEVNIVMPGLASSPEAAALIRATARDEFGAAVTKALDAAAAGAGSRGG